MTRGLRAVLAHQVIFAWNRLGLTYAAQSNLSALAREAVMADNEATVSMPRAPSARVNVTQMPTDSTEATDEATRLRDALADDLLARRVIRTSSIEAAIRTVPRHRFLPGTPLADAYADEPVYTKRDAAGVAISAASQPAVVAMMLEQLDARPGQRILELGAGTGYNAGLLAALVGPDGQVTTIDVDDDIINGARQSLTAAGYPNVRVILRDGALGHPDQAPYDRVIATVAAWDIPAEWLRQLTPDGRLLVPIRLNGAVSRSIAFNHVDGRWLSDSIEMCTFMPLRGLGDDPRRTVRLTDEGDVNL